MNSVFKNKKKSIQLIVLSYTILLIIMQTVFCSFIIFFSGITKKLDDSNHIAFSNMVSYKVSTLEDLLFRSSDIFTYYNQVSEQVDLFLDEKKVSFDTLVTSELVQTQILQTLSPIVLDSLRNSPANSCFIILDSPDPDGYKNCIYFRDPDPLYNAKDHSDIIVKCGNSFFMKEYPLSIDTLWSPQLNTDTFLPFYHAVLQSAYDYPNLSAFDLGYFTPVYKLHNNDDTSCLAYCVPLLDNEHKPYGMIGFDITLDYLKTLLDHNGISIDENGCFILAKKINATTLQPIFVENIEHFSNLTEKTLLHYRASLPQYDIYEIKKLFHPEKVSMCMKPFSLYKSNSPYIDDQFVICALSHNNVLFHSALQVNRIFIFYFFILIFLTILCTILLSRRFRHSVHSLLTDVSTLSPGYTKLKRTGIAEFDELASAIEKQNIEIYQSSMKTANIFDSSEIQIAILEIANDNSRLFCNHKLFEILCLDDHGWELNYIDKNLLLPRLLSRCQCFIKSHEHEDDYLYRTPEQTTKWINVKQIHNPTSTTFVFRDISEEVNAREKLLHERDYDVLTNLFNRRAFAREMTYLLDKKNCSNGVLSIWDLDNLKYTNDTYGHNTGDKYICLLAETLKTNLDVSSVCARLAGDEFTLFLYGAPNDVLKEKLLELHALVMKQKLSLPDGNVINMSVSCGMSCYTEDAPNYQELLRYADFSMYEVKKSSKGNIKAYDKESYIKNHILVQGQGELDRIITENAIRFYFQPICSMETHRILGYEALMRPVSDLLGRPENLIRVAMAQSKLGQIERLTWYHALQAFFAQKSANENIKLFLNSIPNQILSDQDFEELENIYQNKLSSIVLEITEATHSETGIEEKKRAFCNKWNIPLALDDYGSGYSNSDILFTRDFNYIKLDMRLVRNIHKSESMQNLVSGMITYCHSQKLIVIAEGIESEEEFALLKNLGADYGQGFYFGKPSPYLL